MSTDQIKDSLAYLATPYSKWPLGLHDAFVEVSKLAARLLVAGVKVYSPIAHTHPLATYGFLDALDHTIWLPFDEAMMRVSDVLIVAHMDGWQQSKGVAHEIEFFKAAGKPIFDLDPGTLRMTKRQSSDGPSNKPFDTMSLDELHIAHAYWDAQIRGATRWGAALGIAHGFRRQCAALIDRRERESNLAHNKTPSEHAGTSG